MFDVDPLDDTKTWPEDIFPLQPVGRMMFNKSPDNFFNVKIVMIVLRMPMSVSHCMCSEQSLVVRCMHKLDHNERKGRRSFCWPSAQYDAHS